MTTDNTSGRDRYNLRWNNYSNNISQVFYDHLQKETLVDVTICCEGQMIKAHKLILSACSDYFKDVFDRHPNVIHPFILINNMKFLDLQNLIKYMYHGEIKVLDTEIENLLQLGDNLRVKGLCSVKFKKPDESGEEKPADPNDPKPTNTTPPPLASFIEQKTEELKDSPKNNESPNNTVNAAETAKHSRSIVITSPTEQTQTVVKIPVSLQKTNNACNKPPVVVIPPPQKIKSHVILKSPITVAAEMGAPNIIRDSPSPKPILRQLKDGTFESIHPVEIPTLKLTNAQLKERIALAKLPRLIPRPVQSNSVDMKLQLQNYSIVDGTHKNVHNQPLNIVGEGVVQMTDSVVQTSPKCVNVSTGTSTPAAAESRPRIIKVRRFAGSTPEIGSKKRKILVDSSKLKKLLVNDDQPKYNSKKNVTPERTPSKPNESKTTSKPYEIKTSSKPNESRNPAKTNESRSSSKLNESTKDNERSEHKTPEQNSNDTAEIIPRPPNAFMIFANEWRKKIAVEHPGENNKGISIRLGNMWKGMSNETKNLYYKLAKEAAEEHKQKYPGSCNTPEKEETKKSTPRSSKTPQVIDAVQLVKLVMSDSDQDEERKSDEIQVKEEQMEDDDFQNTSHHQNYNN